MAVYQELFYNNVEGLLAANFPVCRETLGDEAWHRLIRGFFIHHRAQTPLFPELPREFLAFLEARGEAFGIPPFLLELAHYEWVELALSIAEAEPDGEGIDPEGDFLSGVPVLSPLAWPLSYRYPVHRIGPHFRPEAPEPACLVVYRDHQDEVGFLEVNPPMLRLLALIAENETLPGSALLTRIAREINHPHPLKVIQGGAEIMERMRQRSILLGTRRPS